MVRFWIAIFIASVANIPTATASDKPVVIVPHTPGYAWWAQKLWIRPVTDRVDQITAANVNSWLENDRGMADPHKLCFFDTVGSNGLVGENRMVQSSIDQTLREYPNSFDQTFVARSKQQFRVRVIFYEACDEPSHTGSGIIITDNEGNLRHVWISDFGFTRLLKRDDGKLNIFACFACGDVKELNYDADNDTFYLRYISH